jgi:hypothetical protein
MMVLLIRRKNMDRIIKCEITKKGGTNEVKADCGDGNGMISIFTYYPDELFFTETEFIGLTVDQALGLFHRKDVEYLRS